MEEEMMLHSNVNTSRKSTARIEAVFSKIRVNLKCV
jgi:hypothetical protein